MVKQLTESGVGCVFQDSSPEHSVGLLISSSLGLLKVSLLGRLVTN